MPLYPLLNKRGYFFTGILFCLAGAICFSTKAIFVKLAYRETTIDAISLLALRMVFSLPFFLISALVSSSQQRNVRFTTRQWLMVAFIGCLGYYVSSLLDFLGLQYISAGMERLILFVYPTFVVLISSFVFKAKITTVQWTALVITYGGLLLAFASEINFMSVSDDQFYLGGVLIFGCAITYAYYIVGSGKIIPVVGAAKFNSYAMSFACIAVLAHFHVTSDYSLFDFDSTAYFYGLLMAVFSTVVPSYLISEGIKRVGSDNAAIIGSIGPVSTIIQAYFFLGEPILGLQLLGTGFVLAGVLLISKRSKQAG